MSSFGYVVGETSLPPSGSLYLTPAPWRPPSSIPHPPPIVRVFFNGVMKRTSTLEPNFTELGPGRSEISRRVSNPSNPALLPSPAPRKIVGEAARRRAGNRTFGGATPGDPFLPITNPVRKAGWPRSTVSTLRLQLGRIGVGRTGSPGGGED